VPSLPSTEEEARANLASQGMCAPRKFLCFPLPTPHLRTSLCRNSRESCSLPEDPLLCTSHFPLPISDSRCAATRVRAALHRKFLCYALPTSNYLPPNYVAPQLARELLFTGRSSVMHIPLPTAYLRITLCRNSHENWSFESSFAIHFPPPIFESHYAATRARTAASKVPLLSTSRLPSRNYVMPQLA